MISMFSIRTTLLSTLVINTNKLRKTKMRKIKAKKLSDLACRKRKPKKRKRMKKRKRIKKTKILRKRMKLLSNHFSSFNLTSLKVDKSVALILMLQTQI